MAEPLISWYEGNNAEISEVTTGVNFGRVDADTDSPHKIFYIWNNRNGTEDVSKMEEVTFTTRDRSYGVGDTVGNIVEAVRDDWFRVKVNSLSETTWTPVGKGTNPLNPTGLKSIGTNGTTTNPHASTASTWTSGTTYNVGDYVKPSVGNGLIYKVTITGTSGGTEPTWTLSEGNTVTDNTVTFVAVTIDKTAGQFEILGVENSVLANGSNASQSGANFVELDVYAEVPLTASAGKNLLLQRVFKEAPSYRDIC